MSSCVSIPNCVVISPVAMQLSFVRGLIAINNISYLAIIIIFHI